MARRILIWVRALLGALDQLAHVVLGGPKFILFGGPVPDRDETISSKVGRAAVKGKRWGLIAERIIDALMGTGHCRASIGT